MYSLFKACRMHHKSETKRGKAMKNNKLVPIGEAAKLTGLSIRRVRYLSDKNYIEPPILFISGEISYRYYDQNHIAQMKRIKELQDQGYKLSIAARKASLDNAGRKK